MAPLAARPDFPTDDPMLAPGAFTRIESGVPEFDRLFITIRATLGHNKTSFRGRTGLVRAFTAGGLYPQVWLRDAATIIPASKLFYPLPYLKSWLIEHLGRQGADGALADWLDSRGRTDKNTVETDQETSAIHAAAQITSLVGPAWLGQAAAGTPVLDRLEKALHYVWEARRDKALGLILGAHTADWGDVEMEEPNQRAIVVGPGTHWTADIYDQSQFHRAARALAMMLRLRGRAPEAEAWEARAEDIRTRADRALWQEGPGFYRVHVHVTPLKHDFDEDAMFAMGGNAEAIDAGLASPVRARRIFAAALARQKTYGISTVSGTLLPPYAKGVFKHPALDEPYEYQNGGQWDWFGGKLVLAMFRLGNPGQAETALLEIARKAIQNNGLFEWDDPSGRGHGSAYYAGSAGSLAGALVEGYFGIRASLDGVTIEPRLGAHSGAAHIYVPAAGRFAAYRFGFDSAAGKAVLSWNSDWPASPVIRLRWPGSNPASLPPAADFRAVLDGRPAQVRLESEGDAAVIVLQASPGPHSLTVAGPRPPSPDSRR